ncbi:putative lipid II flippase FtsW [Thioalkalivibrio denitrificans]|uniref:Probable peptidoglycan glycosyltransferase FtsW n=1 Tax=Thioalkalivibrio denitrificans TaxID=108003 RepID=A0A1V3NNL5_9GAMM|nr:putative lipid II flippase FtsW [Thioalkalivibrio denitrificans]OOG26458.1 putative lipid II flippase FtsW [Thioalkalivibrio denitrificans]
MSAVDIQASRDAAEQLRVQLAQRLDLTLVVCVAALLGIGLVMVASASVGIAERHMDNPFYFLYRQALYVLLGLAAAALMYRIRLAYWLAATALLLALTFVLLAVLLIPGVGITVNGSTRWLSLGLFNLQVSEVVKLLITLYMAGYLCRHGRAVREQFSGFLRPMLVLGGVAVLLLAQPDFGAAVVLMAIGLTLLFLGGARLWQFALLLGTVGVALVALAVTTPYRMARLTAFVDPWTDPFNSGFQLTQSLIAIGSGSWFGAGLGASVQKLFYLPEAHNDFLFAVLAEELGLAGVTVVVLLFGLFLWRSFAIARAAEAAGHTFGAYLAYGIGVWISLQAFVNMGVNMGLLPTKGLTLPFMSYGGSSMLVSCAAVGLLLRVHRETVETGALRGSRPLRARSAS